MVNLHRIHQQAVKSERIVKLHEEGIPRITSQHVRSAGQGIIAACREILYDHKTRYPHLY